MKKFVVFSVFALIIITLVFCEGTSISEKMYDEISNYVLNNVDTFSPEKEIEFFDYDSSGTAIGGVYYGYYYTKNNEIEVPDFYSGGNFGGKYESDGGTYFGKPNSGTDWCFVKKIVDNWYYYELHWG